jgi:hypothetical protein
MCKYKLLLLILTANACNNLSIKTGQQSSCCIQTEHQYVEKPFTAFSELVQTAYFSRNDSVIFPKLCRLLNDSVLLRKEKIWLWTSSKIDTISNCIFWELKPVNPEPYLEIRASDRFSLQVCITTGNDILINGQKEDMSVIKQKAIKYIFYPDGENKHIIMENHDIDLIGKTDVSRVAVQIFRDVITVNGLNINEWKLFFDCMHELMLAFEDERNKKSVEIWGVEYHLLNCNKIEALTNVVDYNIIIDLFNTVWFSNCSPPPPPH